MKHLEIRPKSKDRRFIDRTGNVYGRLTVIDYVGRVHKKHHVWQCLCTCGTVTNVQGDSLHNGDTKSCGCLRTETTSQRTSSHKATNTAEYRSFSHAKNRCENLNTGAYQHYGKRGIEFRFNSFEEFYAELGDKPSPKHSLDRIDNDGHYEKGNVRWATQQQQGNNKRNNVLLTIEGVSLSIAAWARASGLQDATLRRRLATGWNLKDAITLPLYSRP